MLDFPAFPTTGQAFGQWLWDGTKWTQGNAPVVTPVVQSFNTRTGAVVFQQADATAVGILNDTGRNLIHNGRFEVAQRGSGPFTANGYTLDRWKLGFGSDTDSVQRIALGDADRAAIGDEAATYALQNTFTGNAAAGAYSFLVQCIEDVRRLAGKTVTVSFWANASVALKLGVSIDQFFGSGGSPSAQVNGNGTAVTLTTAEQRYSVTIVIPSIAGKTLGTNGDSWTQVNFWFSCGATNAVRAGSIGIQSGTINLWGVQLEIGSVATPLAKREYAEELRLCQRYYQVGHVGQSIGGNSWQAGWGNQHILPLPVPMRAQPAIAVSGITQTNCSATAVAAWSNFAVIHSYNVTAATGGVASAADFTATADL